MRRTVLADTVSEWTEIPKGGMHGTDPSKATWSIWYNHAVVPLYAVIGVASFVCSFFMYRCASLRKFVHACFVRLHAAQTTRLAVSRRASETCALTLRRLSPQVLFGPHGDCVEQVDARDVRPPGHERPPR